MGAAIAIALTTALSLFPPGEGPPADTDAIGLDQKVSLSSGDYGPLVEYLQVRLTNAGFRPGEADGTYGRATYQAVLAFEKHHGLPRDGVFERRDWDLLNETPSVRLRSESDRIEIDLGKQVLYLVKDDAVQAVVGVSSGSGGTFINYSGRPVTAQTPEGQYSFFMERNYNHTSYLGTMYKPFYFYGGYAIHGSPSVPGYPASHGCVRVTNDDMDFLRTELELGMTIYLHGQRTDNPSGITAGPIAGPRAA
ncbi:MAG: L,D-transpeptidase family protein [Acidimicrobiia bacterium]|nr:L,D-transpeptidase family protein [Acidimicrobiia bacterium]